MAEDDQDDRLLAREALLESGVQSELYFVEDGIQLLNYLQGKGVYEDRVNYPMPGLVLLDLNMPKMDGREALAKIKADGNLRRIPVVVLTTSRAEDDMVRVYDLGAASYISKPVTFDALVELMRLLGGYWVKLVELP